MTDLDDDQRCIVAHGEGPARVVHGFGAGATTALRARVERLRAAGRRVLFTRPPALVDVALDVVARHDRPLRLLGPDEQRARVARLVDDPSMVDEVATTVLRYQASFLGSEELLVHAEAAGELDRWEELASVTERYVAGLEGAGEVDVAGAVVRASLLLRRPEVLTAERAVVDDIVVDDFQLASFATVRLLTQLAGAGGNVMVAGNPDAVIGADDGASARHLDAFDRRFGATFDVSLRERRRRPTVTVSGEAPVNVAAVIGHDDVAGVVGREWPSVAMVGPWSVPRPQPRSYDCWLFGGPDVPDDDERDRLWHEEERARFLVAGTRATDEVVVVIGDEPAPPFVDDLVALVEGR